MKFSKSSFIGALFVLSIGNSLAADDNTGTIHFTGEIIEPSCEIAGDDGTDSTVQLGTWPTSLFTDVGIESDLVQFSIILDNCPIQTDGLANVQLTFSGTTTKTGSTTLLDVSQITTTGTTAATGIGIAVSPEGKDTTLLKFDETEGQVYVQLPDTKGDSITTTLNARYKAFATPVTAGPADADMVVNILYR
jgi:type 1 fimbrial protein